MDSQQEPIEVIYCGICLMPPEYCEYGTCFEKCRSWLVKNNPDLFNKLYSDDALVERTSKLSVEAIEQVKSDRARQQRKEEARNDRERKKKESSKVLIQRLERTKRKHITAVVGLEHFGIDLKKTAKLFASKFATGSSVSKTLSNTEEIVIQGDVSDEVYDFLVAKYSNEIPEDNIELIDKKK